MKLLRLTAATPFLLAATFAYADGSTSDTPTASTAVPQIATTAAPAPTAVAAADRDVKVCHSERTIGSNMAKRVCRTKAQLEAEAEEARRNLSGPSERGN